MNLADTLYGFFLELLCRRSKICIFISKEFVGNLSREDYSDICLLMNRLTYKIHSDRRTNGCDIVCSEKMDNIRKCLYNIFLCDYDLVVLASYIIGNYPGILKVNGVRVHSDCKCLNGLMELLRRNSANEGRIKAAGKKKSHFGIRYQTFINCRNKLVMNLCINSIQIVVANTINLCNVTIKNEFFSIEKVSGREGHYLITKTYKVLRLTCHYHNALFVIAIIERTYSNRVACCDVFILLCIVDNAGKLRIEHCKHIRSVFLIERKKYFAIAVTFERIICFKLCTQFFKAIYLAIANAVISIKLKRLHTLGCQSHYRKSVKCQIAVARPAYPRVIGSP